MVLAVDLGAVDAPDKVGDAPRVAPGKCHAQLLEFQEYGEPKSGSHIAKWMILAHTDPRQVGKVLLDFLGQPENAKDEKGRKFATERLLHYCYVLGVTTPEAMVEAKKRKEVPNLDLHMAEGRQAYLNLFEDTYNGRTNTKIANAGFDMFAVNDPKAAGYPYNIGMLKQIGVNPPPAVGAPDRGQNPNGGASGTGGATGGATDAPKKNAFAGTT